MTMILTFNFLVAGILIAVVLHVWAEYRERRLRTPPAVRFQDLCPHALNNHAPTGDAMKYIIGLHAEVADDGVHLVFYQPPNQRGVTSPITGLVSTRLRDDNGTLFEMSTASGNSYLVCLAEEHVRQVLTTFCTWKNGRAHPPDRADLTACGG
jgi:hypothetical protein